MNGTTPVCLSRIEHLGHVADWLETPLQNGAKRIVLTAEQARKLIHDLRTTGIPGFAQEDRNG